MAEGSDSRIPRLLIYKLTLPLLLVSALIPVGALIVGWQQSNNRNYAQIKHRAEHLFEAVQNYIEIDNSRSNLVRLVNSLAGEENLGHIIVVDETGSEVLASNENAWMGRKIDALPEHLNKIIKAFLVTRTPRFSKFENSQTYYSVDPIRYFGPGDLKPRRGLIVVTFVHDNDPLAQIQTRNLLILLSGCYVLIMIFAWALIHRVVHQPIKRIIDAMERRRLGDISARSPVDSKDEIGHFSRQYNLTLEALTQSEERFHHLANNTRDVFWIFDLKEERVVYVNPAYETIWGKSTEQLLENAFDWYDAVLPEDQPRLRQGWGNARAGGAFTAEYRIKTESGAICWISDNGLAVKDDAGKVFRIVGIAREITTQKLVEQEYIRAREVAENLARTRSQFLANMSHEIRTPINGILGASELLLATSLQPGQEEWVHLVKNSCSSLIHIINDILDFSKMDAGKFHIEKKPFELTAVVSEIYQLLKPSVLARGLAFEIAFHPDEPIDLLGDAMRIRQILINLASNAVKFTERGSVALHVFREDPDPSRCHLRLEVRDTGIGIPAEKLELVFGEFSQVDGSISREFGGTGLGLTISRKLAQLMGGDIEVSSQQGTGSCFILVLELERSLNTQKPLVEDAQSLNRHYGKRVLLVEDNKVNQKVIKRMLENLGIEVELAENGAIALTLLAKQSFDLVFMDVQMPVMDGLQATRLIRKDNLTQVPILALTANVMIEDQEACRAAGMNGFLSKPLPKVDLIRELDRWFPH